MTRSGCQGHKHVHLACWTPRQTPAHDFCAPLQEVTGSPQSASFCFEAVTLATSPVSRNSTHHLHQQPFQHQRQHRLHHTSRNASRFAFQHTQDARHALSYTHKNPSPFDNMSKMQCQSLPRDASPHFLDSTHRAPGCSSMMPAENLRHAAMWGRDHTTRCTPPCYQDTRTHCAQAVGRKRNAAADALWDAELPLKPKVRRGEKPQHMVSTVRTLPCEPRLRADWCVSRRSAVVSSQCAISRGAAEFCKGGSEAKQYKRDQQVAEECGQDWNSSDAESACCAMHVALNETKFSAPWLSKAGDQGASSTCITGEVDSSAVQKLARSAGEPSTKRWFDPKQLPWNSFVCCTNTVQQMLMQERRELVHILWELGGSQPCFNRNLGSAAVPWNVQVPGLHVHEGFGESSGA
jgi:hypothetical protein